MDKGTADERPGACPPNGGARGTRDERGGGESEAGTRDPLCGGQ
jgi:hypothetical protein